MPPVPANDNAPTAHQRAPTRPASFDAAVMAYVPGLRRFASRIEFDRELAADLVTDTLAEAFEKYDTYRGGDLWAWLRWQMRRVNDRGFKGRKRQPVLVTAVERAEADAGGATAANQEPRADLSNVVSMLSGRGGDMLMRIAMGEELQEVGTRYGVSKQRVKQIVEREREKVRERCGMGGDGVRQGGGQREAA